MNRDFSDFMAALHHDYFRLERPPLTISYKNCLEVANSQGWAVPSLSTARRLLADDARRAG